MRSLKMNLLLGAAVAGMALLPGCGGSSSTTTPQPQPLNWTACNDLPNTECAVLKVPVDHAQPKGQKLGLQLARAITAVDQSKNRGMLLIIPGGPGVGIADTFGTNRGNFHVDDFSKNFDVVSFDPRGVGKSNPIGCSGTVPTPIAPLDSAPASDQFTAIGAANAAFVESCVQSTGDLMLHLTSNDTADDIESIRLALTPNRKLVAYGVSYGTLYSEMYLERYGDHVKTLVIDGVFDHSIQFPMNLATDIATTQDAFNRFSSWCDEEATCAIHGQDVGAVFDADIALVPQLRFIVPVSFAAGQKGWCDIAKMLKSPPPSHAPDSSTLGSATGLFLGVTCGDEGPQSDYTALLSAYASVFQSSPRFAWKFWDATPYLHFGAGVGDCVGWPNPAGNPPHVLQVGPHPNVLVASTLHDPATSIAYALAVRAQIPESRLLTADTDGHQSMFNSQCAYDKIHSFLLDNKSLPVETECPPNAPTVCTP